MNFVLYNWHVWNDNDMLLLLLFRMLRPSRADVVDRWGHDAYVEDQQGPRQDWEIAKVRKGGVDGGGRRGLWRGWVQDS